MNMRLLSKLLLAHSTTDVESPDGSRVIKFQVTSKIPELSPWDIEIIIEENKITVTIQDEGQSRFNPSSIGELKATLMRRVDAMYSEIVALKKYPALQVEQALADMRSQIVSVFEEISPTKAAPWYKRQR
jgi:HSP20 family molecular chaperone IbpA